MLVPIPFALLVEASEFLVSPLMRGLLAEARSLPLTWALRPNGSGRPSAHAPACSSLRSFDGAEVELSSVEGSLESFWSGRCPQCPDPIRGLLAEGEEEELAALRKAALLLQATRLPEGTLPLAAHQFASEALRGLARKEPGLFAPSLLDSVRAVVSSLEAALAADPLTHLTQYAALELVGSPRRPVPVQKPGVLEGVRGLYRGLASAWRLERELGVPGLALESVRARASHDAVRDAFAVEVFAALDREYEADLACESRRLVALPVWWNVCSDSGPVPELTRLASSEVRGVRVLEASPTVAAMLSSYYGGTDFGLLLGSDTSAVKEIALSLYGDGPGLFEDAEVALQAARMLHS